MWNFLIIVIVAIIFSSMKSANYFQNVNPVSFSANLPAKLDGSFKRNEALDKTEHLFENFLHWPEAFAVHQDSIYTGLGDGRIVRIIDNKIETVCQTGKECGGQHEEHICGRPLGMEFRANGLLYVVDGYHGLFSINVKTGKKNNILPSTTVVDNYPLKFLDDLAIDDKEGVIYLTQPSTKWDLSMFVLSVIEHESTGRLLKYDMKTKDVTVLLSNLSFPNGVILSHDGEALLIAEGIKNKIVKYHLRGPKTGLYTDFSPVLPGEPDNISKNKRGNYWVGISSARSLESPGIQDRLDKQPILRRVFLYLYKLFTAPIAYLMKIIPNKRANEIGFELSTLRILAELPCYGMIVELDAKGKVVRSLQSPNGNVCHISEILEHNGYLYLGSWKNNYLGRLKL